MKKGWYILNYHDISWEENLLLRGIGGTFSPDIFQDHVFNLKNNFRLMSVRQAHEKFKKNEIDEPVLSFWFDDGFRGNRKNALPILQREQITAAISINSRFLLRQEMFWRFKLSFINFNDGSPAFKNKLRKSGMPINGNLKAFVMDHFSDKILKMINEQYLEMTTHSFRDDAFRIFDDVQGISTLQQNGWLITNHSAAHYPVSEESYLHELQNQFAECDRALKEFLQIESPYWVLPFERKEGRTNKLNDVIRDLKNDKCFVFMGDKINKDNIESGNLHRIGMPNVKGNQLVRQLSRLPYAG